MTARSYSHGGEGEPRLAIRRHGDRCFHRVEEVVPGAAPAGGDGYIVDGVMIGADEVAETVELDDRGVPVCRKQA